MHTDILYFKGLKVIYHRILILVISRFMERQRAALVKLLLLAFFVL